VIAGHFAFAAAVRSRDRSAPLWALMLASQWLDVVFVPLFAVGAEGMQRAPGAPPGYGEGLFHIPWTHSLLGAAVLAVLFGAVSALRWGRRAGVVLAGVVLSHWVLDAIVHRPDLPLVPWGGPSVGFGLWNQRGAAMALELALVIAGSALYFRSAPKNRPGRAASATIFLSGIVTLGLNALGF
jgi:LexA-binding, inner membrane-associated putative hydrolase